MKFLLEYFVKNSCSIKRSGSFMNGLTGKLMKNTEKNCVFKIFGMKI